MDPTNCDGCKFANWERTKAGRLHPGKAGRCMALGRQPAIFVGVPASFYLPGWAHEVTDGGQYTIKPSSGTIERGRSFFNNKTCSFKELGLWKDPD